MSIDITTNVYGRLSARRTSHIMGGAHLCPPAGNLFQRADASGTRMENAG